MLDEDWLKSLRFEVTSGSIGQQGFKVTNLLGLGSTKIVFEIEDKNGEKFALKIYHTLGFFLKEIPSYLVQQDEYDVDRINQKIYNLIGNPLIDKMCWQYGRLYSYIISCIYHVFQEVRNEKLSILSFIYKHQLNEEDFFILKTLGIKHRLNDLASLSLSLEEVFIPIQFNFPFPIIGFKGNIISWAEVILSGIEELVPEMFDLKPQSILNNPLYVWGAAIMDDLLTEEAMPLTIAFIHEKFGNLVDHSEAANWITQISCFANLYVQRFKDDDDIRRIKNFSKFCLLAGYWFPIYDENGKIINV